MGIEEFEFEYLVMKVLEKNNCTIKKISDPSVDLFIESKGLDYIVNIKFYKTVIAQFSLIKKAISRSKISQQKIQDEIDDGVGNIVVVSSFLDPESKIFLEESEGVILIDLADLFSICAYQPELQDQLIKLLEIPEYVLVSLKGRNFDDLLFKYEEIEQHRRCDSYSESDSSNTSDILIEKLKQIPLGKKGWKAYEDVMIAVLKYLFSKSLRGWHVQYASDNNLNRYDCVCGIKPNTEFWDFLVNQVQSKYILFEFKNYTEEIEQGEILTTEKYLFDNAFRKVAIVFTRLGAKYSAQEMCRGAMRENGRLILILNDLDVINMLNLDKIGSDSSDYLLNMSDDFLMKLSR